MRSIFTYAKFELEEFNKHSCNDHEDKLNVCRRKYPKVNVLPTCVFKVSGAVRYIADVLDQTLNYLFAVAYVQQIDKKIDKMVYVLIVGELQCYQQFTNEAKFI